MKGQERISEDRMAMKRKDWRGQSTVSKKRIGGENKERERGEEDKVR